VSLLLTNEDDITTGEGVAIMGQATEVRLVEGTNTQDAGWQPWAQSIPFRLSDTPGSKTITVEYRDELGRGMKMTRTFNVSTLASTTPTTKPSATSTAKLTTTATKTAAPTRTASTVTNTPTPRATATAQATTTSQPTDTSTPPPTATPLPTQTPSETPTPAPTSSPTSLPTAVPTLTPAVISTPIILPSPTATATLPQIAAQLATLPAGSRLTPPAPRPAPTERPLFTFEDSPGVSTFALLIGLQAIVWLMVSVAIMMRARRRS
jgi:hypothetical protein